MIIINKLICILLHNMNSNSNSCHIKINQRSTNSIDYMDKKYGKTFDYFAQLQKNIFKKKNKICLRTQKLSLKISPCIYYYNISCMQI